MMYVKRPSRDGIPMMERVEQLLHVCIEVAQPRRMGLYMCYKFQILQDDVLYFSNSMAYQYVTT